MSDTGSFKALIAEAPFHLRKAAKCVKHQFNPRLLWPRDLDGESAYYASHNPLRLGISMPLISVLGLNLTHWLVAGLLFAKPPIDLN